MTEDDKAPWTIKAISHAARDRATKQAKQHGQNIGDWLAMAITNQVELERRATVIPPGRTGQTNPVVAYQDPVPLDLAVLAQASAAVTAMAQAAAETPALRGLSADVAGLLRDQVRLARGLPLLRRRPSRE